MGVFQSHIKLAVTITCVYVRDRFPLQPQRHPAEHQKRRQYTLSPAGLQNDGLQWGRISRAWTGGRGEDFSLGEEPVGQVGEEVHTGQRRKKVAWRGRKEHREQEQRHWALPGFQRTSAATLPWQLRRHLLTYLRGIPWNQSGLRANSRNREPLWHSTPNKSSLWRIPIKPTRN